MKRLFSTAPDAKKRRRTEVTEVTGRGLCLTGRVRSLLSVCACLGILIGRGGAPGHDRPDASGRGGCLLDSNRTLGVTRPVSSSARPVTPGGLLKMTGRCLCGLRFSSVRIRSPTRWSAARLDQRVRSVTGPARPVELRAFGLCNQRVRSARLQQNRVPNGSIRRGTSINTCWPAQGSRSCTI
jgi:hypothetical protein